MAGDKQRLTRQVRLLLGLMMIGATAVRLYHIDQPVVTFHPTRHYRSAVIARACYYDATTVIPDWARQVSDANRAMQPAGEPPIMEWLACASYLVLGHENAIIPRIFASGAWVAGAIPLYLLTLRMTSPSVALIAPAIYLFLPYGIVASRNFQPDALMTLCSLWALLALVTHHERPSWTRLAVAAGGVALALLIKPMSLFITIPVLLGLAILQARAGLRATIRVTLLLLGLGVAPATIYYGYSALFGTLARDQMRMRFVPHLLISAFFWNGWLTQIQRVFTTPLFISSLLGLVLAPTRIGRCLLAALWLGYLLFAVAFTYHMPTHDYYHWPYIAVVALGIAAVISRGLTLVATFRPSAPAHDAAAPFAAAAACAAIAALGSWQAWPRLTVAGSAATLARYQAIGTLTEHSTKVLFLDLAYGYPLMYHGELSGDAWPGSDDLAAEALGGASALDATARFARDYASFAPRFFVATDLASLEAQPDLRALLAHRAVVVERTAGFHVYRFK